MRYALIADVHGNLPALRAVLTDAAGPPGSLYHLGDLVGYAPWPNEVVRELRAANIAGVAGNYDSTVATDHHHCGCRAEDEREEALAHRGYAWTLAHTDGETKRYLGSLPFRIDLRPQGGHLGGPKVVLVHGTPLNNLTYWTEDRPDGFCSKMAEVAGAAPGDVIVCGHTHKPWHRVVAGVHFVNAGSVGRPKDGDWRACYLLLELAGGEVRVDFRRVEYDIEEATRGIRASGLPTEFADVLRTGGRLVGA